VGAEVEALIRSAGGRHQDVLMSRIVQKSEARVGWVTYA
jgi:hypothetical protein